MGLRDWLGGLLRRKARSPLDEARAAAQVLNRKGHLKRRKHPPRPDERYGGGVTWGDKSWSDSVDTSDSGGGGGND